MFHLVGDLFHYAIEAGVVYGVYKVGVWKGRKEKSGGILRKFL